MPPNIIVAEEERGVKEEALALGERLDKTSILYYIDDNERRQKRDLLVTGLSGGTLKSVRISDEKSSDSRPQLIISKKETAST